jgi:hypothetical protein
LLKSLVQPLFEGPVDIVGDVHGELDALLALMTNLGYDEQGRHLENRRMIFVGDLTDRGPDSPGVIDLVSDLIDSGHAQSVLGNHDFNILLGSPKLDNHWFFGEPWSLDGTDEITPAKIADDGIRKKTVEFFISLPLVLERSDLRIVHACWNDSMVELVRKSTDVLELYLEHKNKIQQQLESDSLFDPIEMELLHQNRNPVKVTTSGIEHLIDTPYVSSGKLRHHERTAWWNNYDSDVICVFGHYSNYRVDKIVPSQAMCIDYAVAKRWQERKSPTFNGKFRGLLAAMRFPERAVFFDNGESETI